MHHYCSYVLSCEHVLGRNVICKPIRSCDLVVVAAEDWKRISVAVRSSSKEGGLQNDFFWTNLVPRVFSLSNMAAAGEKTLAHSRNHVTDLSLESGNLFKMASKIKSERMWVRDLETGGKKNGGKGKLERS